MITTDAFFYSLRLMTTRARIHVRQVYVSSRNLVPFSPSLPLSLVLLPSLYLSLHRCCQLSVFLVPEGGVAPVVPDSQSSLATTGG